MAQALLLAVSIIPIGRAATAELGTAGGGIVSVAYGLAWGVQEAVGFDFHEICFAVPLLAVSLNRLLASRWNAAAVWAVPLVAVKEDLPLTVAAIGAYLILRGRRRLGALLVVGGLAAAAVIVGLVLPWFNPEHTYAYSEQLGRSTQGWGLATKVSTVVLLLLPTLGVAVRSPLLLIAVPTLAWRFAADNHLYWGDDFHYNAVLMPIAREAGAELPDSPLPAARVFRVDLLDDEVDLGPARCLCTEAPSMDGADILQRHRDLTDPSHSVGPPAASTPGPCYVSPDANDHRRRPGQVRRGHARDLDPGPPGRRRRPR